jgi:hypothetical protein
MQESVSLKPPVIQDSIHHPVLLAEDVFHYELGDAYDGFTNSFRDISLLSDSIKSSNIICNILEKFISWSDKEASSTHELKFGPEFRVKLALSRLQKSISSSNKDSGEFLSG